ncbi:hypothetical protein Y032_0006g3115 [Ancylostoma ceylanicum]|uniref:Uncharacterized protein n=1 Tax=Ancylostoma ceylanicum TaxID=53326 RepID=A0A016VQS8_9BILA|nr:hypothetical protein Y032_0006g3115 [Ancylostoma ceylanicum]
MELLTDIEAAKCGLSEPREGILGDRDVVGTMLATRSARFSRRIAQFYAVVTSVWPSKNRGVAMTEHGMGATCSRCHRAG